MDLFHTSYQVKSEQFSSVTPLTDPDTNNIVQSQVFTPEELERAGILQKYLIFDCQALFIFLI